MTTKQLSFKGPPQIAVAVGATTPNPGITGVTVWSSTTNAMMQWTGTSWQRAGNAPGDLLAWDSRVKSASGWGSVTPYVYGGADLTVGTGNVAGTATGGTMVYPSGATPLFVDTHIAVDLVKSPASSFSGCFVGSASCDLYRQGGFVFEAAAGLSTIQSTAGLIACINMGNAGGTSGTGFYQSTGNTDLIIGMGRDEGDPVNAAYLLVGNGTTRSKTLLTRTGAGYSASTGLTFQVQVICAPGASAATINVVDLSNNYPCLANHSVSLATFPTNAAFAAVVGSATGATSAIPESRLYGFSYSPYPGSEAFTLSASNIAGNAATATELATARNIQGVPFDGSTDISVISIGTTAPVSPVLNQLWIQT